MYFARSKERRAAVPLPYTIQDYTCARPGLAAFAISSRFGIVFIVVVGAVFCVAVGPTAHAFLHRFLKPKSISQYAGRCAMRWGRAASVVS